jgi:hypothetical protein
MKGDLELETWKKRWVSKAGVPAGIAARIEREGLKFKLSFVPPVMVTAIACIVLFIRFYRESNLAVAIFGLALLALFGMAWWLIMKIYQGTWASAAVTATAYLDLCVQRRLQYLLLIRIGYLFYIGVIITVVIWNWGFASIPQSFWSGLLKHLPGYLTSSLVIVAALQWAKMRSSKELKEFRRMHDRLMRER